MTAEIISVGTELLLGDILNTNAQFLGRELAELGITVLHQQVIGDNAARLAQIVNEAKQRSDLLVFTGGLGPTADDLTKETVAACYGDTLQFDADEWEKIDSFFKRIGRPTTQNNRKQAMVPVRGKKIINNHGTAPGCFFQQDGKFAALMPGVPREMKAMWAEGIRPILAGMQGGTLHSLTLRVLGGESELEATVGHLFEHQNPTAAIYCKTGECEIRITALGRDEQDAEALCRAYADEFYKILGDSIYDADVPGLEYTLVNLLKQQNKTIATAESLTGGTVARMITNVPGASGVFGFGFVTYAAAAKTQLLGVDANVIEQYNVVSAPVAAQMALGAKRVSGADLAVALTGLAGPDGGTPQRPVGTVYVAAACGDTVTVRRLNVGGRRERDVIRQLAARNALDLCRRLLLGLPVPDSRTFAANAPADEMIF